MATFESVDIVAELVEHDGNYDDDPQAHSIYSYRTMAGKIVYAVYYHESHVDIFSSPYVQSPVTLLWSRDIGVTMGGKLFLQSIAREKARNPLTNLD